MPRWEVRSALRHGSKHEGYVTSETKARDWAKTEIERHGNVGRIEYVDHNEHIIYYDVFEEMA